MNKLVDDLFKYWRLDVWSDILGIIGFVVSIITVVIGFSVKSQVNRIRASYIFDRRIADHLNNLIATTNQLNTQLNDYDNNIRLIQTEIVKCQAELEDLSMKLNSKQSRKVNKLIKFINARKTKVFVCKSDERPSIRLVIVRYYKSFFNSTYDDVWKIYTTLHEIIRQIENIRKNKKNYLK